MPRPKRAPATCVAPDETGRLCGKPATEEREIDELVMPLCSAHAAEIDEEDEMETKTLTPWREVPMFWLESDAFTGEHRELAEADRLTALREYRRHGCINGVVLADPSDYDCDGRIDGRTDLPDLTEAGPSVDEIDWTGFPIEITLSAEDRQTIINAILERQHVSGGPGNHQHYRIEVFEDGSTRTVWDQNTHFKPEPALWLDSHDLLDTSEGMSYTWGEPSEDSTDEEEEEQARDWIESNLLSGDIDIEMPDGSTRTITVRWGE